MVEEGEGKAAEGVREKGVGRLAGDLKCLSLSSSALVGVFSSLLDLCGLAALGNAAGADDGLPVNPTDTGELEPKIDENDDNPPANADVAAANTDERGGALGTLTPSPLTMGVDVLTTPVMIESG
jgi:hypothetical protein